MSTKIEKFKKLLIKHGIRVTHQRLVILEFLNENRIHPTVEDIYEAIKDKVTTISKTTVYNTLHTFIENGLVKDLLITANEVHYDLDGYPHHHFLCKECGKIYDLPVECCYHATGIVQGHKICEMQGYFKGICKECLNKMGADEDES
ncbi:MAG: Fur family transcriptional regulator [Candidatus Zixiibacteriota bacterium]